MASGSTALLRRLHNHPETQPGTDAPWSPNHRTPRQRPAPTNIRSFSFLLSQWTLRLTLRRKSLSLGERTMRHFSVLLSAQSASNLNKNDQPLQALTRAATLKTASPAKARLLRGIATAAI